MNPRILIDAIVQQTTVLIAQLSTSAGLRSPLAHLADQVFLSLAQEIERQGVSRKIVADMFGLALRSYQRKVQRLAESGSASGKTLWEAVLAFVSEGAPLRRERIVERFRNDDQLAVMAVLNDLVGTGLVYSAGRGEATVYGATSDSDRKELSSDDGREALAVLLWGAVFRNPGMTTRELMASARVGETESRTALDLLLGDGRVVRGGESDDAPLHAAAFLIPVGAEVGWEAAVFDHYQAAATAIAARARLRASGAASDPTSGGTTLHFGIHPGHPFEARVLGILTEVRGLLNGLWKDVSQYNEAHPIADEAATRVTFYFGQHVLEPAEPQRSEEPAPKATKREER